MAEVCVRGRRVRPGGRSGGQWIRADDANSEHVRAVGSPWTREKGTREYERLESKSYRFDFDIVINL